jgi:type IV secretion system protein TrbL
MADDVQSILATAFNEIAAGLTTAASSVSLTTISAASDQANSDVSTNGAGTRASRSTSSQSGGSSLNDSLLSLISPAAAGAASSAGSSASTAEKIASFLPMGGLIEGLISLFGGGSSAPAPLVKYAMPGSADFTANLNANGSTSAADFGQSGMARPYGDSTSSGSGSQGNGNSSPINLTINALDSQSILNRADDIAAAVRGAMLNGNSINDVINNDL